MTCTRLTEKLDDYVDGLMDRAESAALGAHIETCNDCHQVRARAGIAGIIEGLRTIEHATSRCGFF